MVIIKEMAVTPEQEQVWLGWVEQMSSNLI